jgi:glycosyltransferase involved in cell wall biosynthesis
MKILQVSPTYLPIMDGGAEYVKNISERLATTYEVIVFTCDSSGKLPKEEFINGVRVKRFRCFSPGNAYYLSPGMTAEMMKNQFDIVHAHNYHALPLYFSHFAKKNRFIVNPYYHAHGHTPFRNLLFKLYKPLGGHVLGIANKIISLSYTEKAALIKDFPRISDKITTIPPGNNLQNNLKNNRFVKNLKNILCVGRLEEYKGVQEIIQVLPLLEENFRLSVVGKGEYKDSLTALVNNLGLEERVSFYQDLPRIELLKMYSEAGIFVLLSKFESYSIVVAEALACGTPCIVANTSGLTEWVDQKICYGIDYPINYERLASLINSVSGKQIDKIKLRDWDETVQEIINIYES